MSTTRPSRATTQSQQLFERAQQHLAGGVGSGTRSPRAGWAPTPIYVAEASGSRVTDVDGTTYIDYQMGQGPLILGHRPPELLAAVTRAINERGSHLALCHELEGQAADAVAARVPSIELLRFGNSGTECVQYALRFARAATGRRLIVRFEGHYHGWSDAIHFSAHPDLASAGPADQPTAVPGSSGMAGEVASSLLVLPWNDPEAIDRAFAEHGDEIAAVITEPIMGNGGGMPPAPGFLEHLRERTREAGSLLIFDEVLTGFRVGREGAQGLFGIEPDLTILAKALGGGFPVAAVGGSRSAMAVVSEGRTMHGGTYNSNALACAAVIAATEATGRPGFYEELLARGDRLAAGLVGIAREAGFSDACHTGVGSLFQLWLGGPAPTDYRSGQALVSRSPFPVLFAELLEQRIIVQPPQEGLFLMSGAHTDEDVERTLEAAAAAMPAVARAAEEGRVGPTGGVR
jgi:glutamate-1-semialdehyde 2,1-aminomutase